MAQDALYFITGSSGSGKTTPLQLISMAVFPRLSTYHVDALGSKSDGRAWVQVRSMVSP